MTPQFQAALWRGLKVVLAEAALGAVSAAWSLFTSNGNTFLDPAVFALVTAVGSPLVLAAEKWLHWYESEATPVVPPAA